MVVSWGACAERCGCGACGRGLPLSPWVCGFVGPPVSPWTRCSAGGAAGFSVDPLFCWFGSPLAGGSVFAWSPEGAIGCGQAAVSWWVRSFVGGFALCFVPFQCSSPLVSHTREGFTQHRAAHKGGIYATPGRTQGRDLRNTGPHTRAGSSPCVRRVFRKSGSLCAYSEEAARDPEQSARGPGAGLPPRGGAGPRSWVQAGPRSWVRAGL